MVRQQRKQGAISKESGTPPGACAGQPESAALQDLLIYCLMGLSQVAVTGVERGIKGSRAGVFTAKAAVATFQGTAFDSRRLIELIEQAVVLRDQLRERISAMGTDVCFPAGPADFEPATTLSGLLNQAGQVGPATYPAQSPEIRSLKQILLQGIRGVASHADLARILGCEDEAVFEFLLKGLAAVHRDDLDMEDWTGLILNCGKVERAGMALLDKARSDAYGRARPERVPLGAMKGKAILVSGRDFRALDGLLRQTSGTGIKVYTHDGLLSAHQYPGLKHHSHLCGHYKGAGENPGDIFSRFPGAVLITGHDLLHQGPAPGNHLFTSGSVHIFGIPHIKNENFRPVIDQALRMPGFTRDDCRGEAAVGPDRVRPRTRGSDF